MLTVYLSSPGNQMHADHLQRMPVLLSYAAYRTKGKHAEKAAASWIESYAPSFGRVLIDSGAFSEFNSGQKIELPAYQDWAQRWRWADAIAALDDIRGDWQRGLANWEAMPGTFPTYHDSDPLEALEEILKRRPKWLGLGMVPGPGGQRSNERWLRETLEYLEQPEYRSIHVHGWALRAYTHYQRLNSVDSTNWLLDVQKILTSPHTRHLTPAEGVEIIVKRYQREGRKVLSRVASEQGGLFQ